jgi:signal transduction histidine kinase
MISTNKEQILYELLAFTQSLKKGDFTKRVISNVDDSELSQICINLNAFADQLQINPPSDQDIQLPVHEFIDVISSYANRNFEKKLPISENSNFLDALATGINILGEELEYTTYSKNELELERNQLKIEKEKAEEASRLKSVFLGNLSHEVRTPLQGIYGFAELLESTSLTEAQRQEYLGFIKRRTNDLQNIIESLLDMASLETGEIKSFPANENLKLAIDEIFESFQQDFQLQSTAVVTKIENHLAADTVAKIDATHLKRVVTNLLINSGKFTKEGSILLKAKENTECFEIEVQDSGIGIAKEKLEIVFEPFRQAHEGVSRNRGGIGLGLAICKKMVTLWGGEIYATSEVDKGSSFFFTIPK